MNIVIENFRVNTDRVQNVNIFTNYVQYMPVSHNSNTNNSSGTN